MQSTFFRRRPEGVAHRRNPSCRVQRPAGDAIRDGAHFIEQLLYKLLRIRDVAQRRLSDHAVLHVKPGDADDEGLHLRMQRDLVCSCDHGNHFSDAAIGTITGRTCTTTHARGEVHDNLQMNGALLGRLDDDSFWWHFGLDDAVVLLASGDAKRLACLNLLNGTEILQAIGDIIPLADRGLVWTNTNTTLPKVDLCGHSVRVLVARRTEGKPHIHGRGTQILHHRRIREHNCVLGTKLDFEGN